MKISIIMCLLTIFSVSATKSYSQIAEISLDLNNVTVKEAFDAIKQQSDYSFWYRNDEINLDKKVSIHAKKQNITAVMRNILDGQDLSYTIDDTHIVIYKQNVSPGQAKKKITGTISDEMGEPIIGANVVVKGTNIGTTTDANGMYSLDVPENATLQISYIGYIMKEIHVGKSTTISTDLSEDTKALEEVVVVGFGTQKKVNLTGAVSVVDSKALESRPITTVTQALQGAVPGMNFSYGGNGGEVGNNLNINIRGAGTIGNDSNASPLVLIDGMEGDINNLNPQDVESISVLKDAASSAVYGSRAPFGVILVTTKRGKSGQVTINYNNSIRFTNAINKPSTPDSYTYAKYMNRAALNNGQTVTYDEAAMQRILDYQNGVINTETYANADGTTWNWVGNANNNWYDIMFGETHTSHEHNVSISGGTDKIQYYASGNYLMQNGIISYASDQLQRYTSSAKINAKVTDYLKINYNLKWIRNEISKPTYIETNGSQIYHDIAKRWPTEPMYDPNGHLRCFPNFIQSQGTDKQQNDLFYQQIQLEFEFVKNWKIFAELNYRTTNTLQHKTTLWSTDYTVQNTPTNTTGTTYITEGRSRTNFMNPNIYTNYNLNLDNGHNFTFMLGFQSELNKFNDLGITRADLITTEVQAIGAATGKDSGIYGNIRDWATSGFFGRLNYNYKERYLLEVSGRYDGTSRFARDQRWNFFPSFQLGWNIAREDFWGNIDPNHFITNLKLRGNWGELGNQNTTNLYPYIQIMPVTSGASNTNWNSWIVDGKKQNISSIPSLISTSLGWETVRLTNLGFDMTMFNNRLNISAEYFIRKTLNMVGPAPALPIILGIAVPRTNNADLTSKGFEIDVNWRDMVGKVSYGVRANLSDDRQKIDRYPNPTGSLNTYLEGQYLGEIWGYETIGIAKTDEEMQNHIATTDQSQVGSKWEAGDIMYKDINGDGVINKGAQTITDHGDLKIIGNSMPRFKFGIDLDAAWEGFDVRVFLQGVGKRDYWCSGNTFFGAAGGKWQSGCFDQHLDFFRPEGDEDGANLDAYFARPIFNGDKNQQTQTRYLQNAAYLRLKNAQIGYTFPRVWMEKAHIQKLRVFLSGENLLTFTKLTGQYDPEVLGTGYSGNATKTYPLVRTISVGLSINF